MFFPAFKLQWLLRYLALMGCMKLRNADQQMNASPLRMELLCTAPADALSLLPRTRQTLQNFTDYIIVVYSQLWSVSNIT